MSFTTDVGLVPAGMRTAYCGALRSEDAGRSVSVCGWVARRREHGEHLAFVDLRDHTGIIQCVVDGASDLRSEQVLRVTGTVRARPEGTVNTALSTGEVELGDCVVEILSTAEPPPFSLDVRSETDEAVRLRYRYLDLRTDRMQRNLRLRAQVNSALRTAMERQGFVEVETPMLWTPTPEGAREFAIPSRLQHGSFYVLPQSPQIAKQLLMVGGIDRYYQIARCMRDEDLRADRQFEFTQLDIEASFVGQADVHRFVSEAVIEATTAVSGERPPEIVTMNWNEALDRFGTDKPDLRFAMELVDLGEAVAGTEFKAFSGAEAVRAIRVVGGGTGAGAASTRSWTVPASSAPPAWCGRACWPEVPWNRRWRSSSPRQSRAGSCPPPRPNRATWSSSLPASGCWRARCWVSSASSWASRP